MQKKIIVSILTFAMMLLCGLNCFGNTIVTSKDGEQEMIDAPAVNSNGVIVVDMATGYSIYEKDIYGKYYPASITKIMTATVVLENCMLDETVTFSHDAVYSIEPGSSSAYASEGEELSVEQCLYGLMLISGNDLANGLAEHVSGSNDEFSKLMNSKALQLGCVNTNFVNPHGLHDENHYTCAYDMALISKYAYKELDKYRELIATVRYEVPPTNMLDETRYWRNSNKLLVEYEEFYYEDCIGGKPGYTMDAGNTLVSYAKINGRVIMIVSLNATSATNVYTDHATIYDYIKESVPRQYFTGLEALYEKNQEKFQEETTENKEVNATVATNDNSKKDSDKKTNVAFIILKVIGILFSIVVGLYVYLRVRLYLRRRKRNKRKLERMLKQQSRLDIESIEDENNWDQ